MERYTSKAMARCSSTSRPATPSPCAMSRAGRPASCWLGTRPAPPIPAFSARHRTAMPPASRRCWPTATTASPRLRRGLERRQVQLDQAKAVRVFGGSTPAGTEQSFYRRARRLDGHRRPRRADAGRRPRHGDAAQRHRPPRHDPPGGEVAACRSARRSGARSARPFGDGGILFRQGRRLSPDHRCRRAPVHRLPVLFGAQAGQGHATIRST